MAKNDKQAALGGNYKLKEVKIFASKENLYRNAKKYRKVFDTSECRYIYCELSMYNKLFDEVDWNTTVTFYCKEKHTGTILCDIKKELTITKSQNIVYINEGWGTPAIGWWKKGAYYWEIRLDDKVIGKTEFYIVDGGPVLTEKNPYFNIKEIRLFESTREGLPLKERIYLKKFAADFTRYVNVEMILENLKPKEDSLPIELKFYFYNDSGQKKAYMHFFKEFNNKPPTIKLDTGYGAAKPGYWFEDIYFLEIVFMDQLIAVVPFEVGEFEEAEGAPLSYSANSERETAVAKSGAPIPEVKLSFEEAKSELEALIGLHSVKKQINELATYLQFLKVRKEKGLQEDQQFNLHSVFTGNPGTGKTTVANLLGKIYHSLDLLSHGTVHEVGRADLVGEFIGQTAPKVKKALEKARGGILFIDEAYALTNRGEDGKDFGREVIEVLLKELSDGSNDLAIIFAGYPKEMKQFLNSNSGLNSRLRNIIQFPDYTPEELMEVADYSAGKRGVIIHPTAMELIHKRLIEIYRNRDDQFGNARYINGIIEEAKQNMAIRLTSQSTDLSSLEPEDLSTITEADIHKIFQSGGDTNQVQLPVDEALLQDALKQLHDLVGLEEIKKEVDEMTKLVRYYREIGKDIKRSFSVHTVFMGNPGTGKTTIARLLVQIYKALGILERGHLVECDRKSLVAGFVGQTAIKTSEIIDKAMGGGLFIDEAYALTQGGQNDFGREAVETLLKRMEDQRGEFMVIVAGYPIEMTQFLEANPGLMSRFDRRFNFPDYKMEELTQISNLMFQAEELILEPNVRQHLNDYIKELVDNKHKYFGNARTVRKIVKEAIRRQNLRMADLPVSERSEKLVKQITLDDVTDFKLVESDLPERKGIGFR
ncbi:MAG: SpoVK/Ycf46/Vps4 family AAA+-type ATPase [Polaribacter sp.]|jgi:SpoVK/Ycf46/Vps4 family AAA+-type ATPase